MKVKTSELTGAALDRAVAEAEGIPVVISGAGKYQKVCYIPKGKRSYYTYTPSTNWKQGGPIIEREGMTVGRSLNPGEWSAESFAAGGTTTHVRSGPTLLIAAMRCYCCIKLGDVIDTPEELK